MINKTIVESDQRCFRCEQQLEIGNEDRLCPGCEQILTGLPFLDPPFRREAAKLIWRLKRLVNRPFPGSDDPALMAKLDEIARLALSAKAAVREGK